MGQLIAGMASSHAFAIEDVADWDEKRQRNRRHYADRYGELPPEHPRTAGETDEDVARRHDRLEGAYASLRQALEDLQPDAIVFVADDQDEIFTDANFPQVAVYLGGDFDGRDLDRQKPRHPRKGDAELAQAIFGTTVEADIDMASVGSLPERFLSAHAFGPVLQVIDPEARIPVVPVFVNAIHMPAPSPGRCYHLGEVLRQAVEEMPDERRVVIYGSGGLSHFPSSFPPGYHGDETPFPWGSIDEDFDRWLMARMEAGEGRELVGLTSAELIAHGEPELRSWITVLGAVGDARPDVLVYEPFYRGIMGMGVGYWNLEGPPS